MQYFTEPTRLKRNDGGEGRVGQCLLQGEGSREELLLSPSLLRRRRKAVWRTAGAIWAFVRHVNVSTKLHREAMKDSTRCSQGMDGRVDLRLERPGRLQERYTSFSVEENASV